MPEAFYVDFSADECVDSMLEVEKMTVESSTGFTFKLYLDKGILSFEMLRMQQEINCAWIMCDRKIKVLAFFVFDLEISHKFDNFLAEFTLHLCEFFKNLFSDQDSVGDFKRNNVDSYTAVENDGCCLRVN